MNLNLQCCCYDACAPIKAASPNAINENNKIVLNVHDKKYKSYNATSSIPRSHGIVPVTRNMCLGLYFLDMRLSSVSGGSSSLVSKADPRPRTASSRLRFSKSDVSTNAEAATASSGASEALLDLTESP